MILVAGLGNPTPRYEKTRHNIGFMLIDAMVALLQATANSKDIFKGELYKKGDLLLLKPMTYMNASGESLGVVTQYFKPSDIIVAHDDLDLPFGAIRFKQGGGHGGHNGLRSIDSICGNEYVRIRFGIGKPHNGMEVADYVLANFSPEQQALVPLLIAHAIEALMELLKGVSLTQVATRYTTKDSDAFAH